MSPWPGCSRPRPQGACSWPRPQARGRDGSAAAAIEGLMGKWLQHLAACHSQTPGSNNHHSQSAPNACGPVPCMRPVAAHVRPRPLKSHPIADAGGRFSQKHQQTPLNHPNAPLDLLKEHRARTGMCLDLKTGKPEQKQTRYQACTEHNPEKAAHRPSRL